MNEKNNLTPRELVYAALEGRKPEHYPVASPYTFLTYRDHWTELTGLPTWKYHEWLIADPVKHAEMFKLFDEKLPFDVLHPTYTIPTEARENLEVVFKDGKAFYHNKKDNSYSPLTEELDKETDPPNEEQIVFDIADVKEKVKVEKAEASIENGYVDNCRETIKLLGDRKFIFNGWIINTFYMCSFYVGLANLFTLLYDDPDLILYLNERILEQNIERARMYSSAGGDAIFIDDATATSDMISPAMYEKFSLPYLTRTVKEVQRLGKKAIVIYFGGIADRVEQIISTGADALMMETSMKGYVNDYDEIAGKLKGRMALFGNIDPVGTLEYGTEEELYSKVAKQVNQGRKYGKFVSCTGSPITPRTPVSRIRKFIDLAHEL